MFGLSSQLFPQCFESLPSDLCFPVWNYRLRQCKTAFIATATEAMPPRRTAHSCATPFIRSVFGAAVRAVMGEVVLSGTHFAALGCFPNTPVTRCISEKARSAFAAHLIVACMLSAAKRQLSSAKHLTVGVWVTGSVVDVAADHLFGWLTAVRAFRVCICCLGHRVALR